MKGSHGEEERPRRQAPTFDVSRPRIVVIATVHWAATTRLCLEMADRGFEVRALTPADHALFKMCTVTVERLGRTRAEALETIRRTVERYSPDLLIPGDDPAIELLRTLYNRALRGRGRKPAQMAELIEASLGAPSSFVFAYQKSRFVALARQEGLSAPTTQVVRDLNRLRLHMATARFPLVIKRDEMYGGQGVRIVANAAEAERAFLEFRATGGRAFAVRQAIRRLDLGHLRQLCRARPAITVQDYIEGRPANRAVFCHRGQVLAGLSVEALRTSTSTGPATVVRVIDSAEMADATARLVRRLGLSGFVGFDFMLEADTGRPYLLEMNQRPTQICHLVFNVSSDMIGALATALPAAVDRRATPNIGSGTVALFPQESWRDPASDFLRTAHHDVPWQEPEFIDAYREPVAAEPLSWVQIARQILRNPRRLFGRRMEVAPLSTAMNLSDSTTTFVSSTYAEPLPRKDAIHA